MYIFFYSQVLQNIEPTDSGKKQGSGSSPLQPKNVQVKKTHSDPYARVPKHGRMLFLFDPVIGLVEL
jgi:hypothetical protein